jgi:20S proteasome alpha/beta subunit
VNPLNPSSNVHFSKFHVWHLAPLSLFSTTFRPHINNTNITHIAHPHILISSFFLLDRIYSQNLASSKRSCQHSVELYSNLVLHLQYYFSHKCDGNLLHQISNPILLRILLLRRTLDVMPTMLFLLPKRGCPCALFLWILVFISISFWNGGCVVASSSVAGQETLMGIVGSDFVLLGADSSRSQSIALTATHVDKIAVLVDPQLLSATSDATVAMTRQHAMAVAAAGDAADAERLVEILRAYAGLQEYEYSVGCDVTFVDCGSPVGGTHNKHGSESIQQQSPSSTTAGIDVTAMAHVARQLIWNRMRSATPYRVCLLVAGMTTCESSSASYPWRLATSESPLLSERVQAQIQSASVPFTATSNEGATSITHSETQSTVSSSMLQPCLLWLDEYGSMQRIPYGAHGYGSMLILSLLDQKYRPRMSLAEAEQLMRECFAELRTRYVINSPYPPCIKVIDAHGCRVLSQE